MTARFSWPPSSRVCVTPGTEAAITPSPNIPMSSRSTWVRDARDVAVEHERGPGEPHGEEEHRVQAQRRPAELGREHVGQRGDRGDGDQVEEQLGPAGVPLDLLVLGVGRRAPGRLDVVGAHRLTVARGDGGESRMPWRRGSPLGSPALALAADVSAASLAPLHWHEDLDPQADRPPQPPPGRLVRRARSLALGVRVRRRRPRRGVHDRLALDGHRRAGAPGRVPGGVSPASDPHRREAGRWASTAPDALPRWQCGESGPGTAVPTG